MSQYTFQFNNLAAYASAKASGGSIATALSGVSSTDISRSVVSYIKGIGQAVTDSVNLFVPYAKGGLAGDVLYYTGTEYCWLKSPSDALDGSVLGQNIINTSAIPTSWVRVGAVPTSESKDVQIGMQAYQPGAAMVKVEKLLGNSVAWNQLVQNGNFTSTSWWLTYNSNYTISNNTATVVSNSADGCIYKDITVVAGHKYFCSASAKSDGTNPFRVRCERAAVSNFLEVTSSSFVHSSVIVTAGSSSTPIRIAAGSSSVASTGYVRDIILIDLTLMFGESVANTMTVEMFEKLFPLSYYEYNPGDIISNEAAAVKGIGRNLWDERKFLEKGFTGGPGAYTRRINDSFQIKNGVDFMFLPNTQYVIQTKGTRPSGTPYFYILYTDNTRSAACGLGAATNFIISAAGKSVDSIISTYGSDPDHANYTIQEFSICQAGPLNGTYEPYKESIAKLDAKKIYGKLNGTGNYVQVFPDGIRSAGTVYDEVDYQSKSAVVRGNSVDMGTLTWIYYSGTGTVGANLPAGAPSVNNISAICAKYAKQNISNWGDITDKGFGTGSGIIRVKDSAYSDAATFQTAMQGVELLYELVTPKYYTDLKLSDDNGATFHDLPRPFYYTAGLEMKDPQDTASSVTAPARILASYKPIKK